MYQEVKHVEEDYPPPSPPDQSSDQIFHARDYRDIDNRARQAPADLVHDFDALLTYLLKDVTSDLAKVRSIFVWLSDQPVVSTNFPREVDLDTPWAWLKRIKLDRSYYAELFAVLCRKAKVPCVIIQGSSKGAGFEVGQTESLGVTNRWNAVHVQGEWQLVNPPWAFVTTDGVEEGEWVTIEEDGEYTNQAEVSTKKVKQELDEFWFLTDPDDFNAFLHPVSSRWQLLEPPWTDEDFLSTPRFAEEMFKSQWDLVTENKGRLVAEQGTCMIAFVHPTKDVHSASLTYKLSYNVKQSGKPLPAKVEMERYVVVTSKKGEKSIVTRLPQPGVYRIQVAGILNDDLTPLGEFRIECKNVKKEPPPFPEGCQEIGYTEKAEEVGLENPSVQEGIVIAREGDKQDFSFQFSKNKPQPRDIRATVTHSTLPPDKLRGCCQVKRTEDQVTVSVTFPKDKVNKEIGVYIDALKAAAEDDQSGEELDYCNIINYIVTKDAKLACPDQKAIIKAKNDLLDSIKHGDISRFYALYRSMGGNLDPLTRAKVAAFMKEFNKIKTRKMQELVVAMNGTDINLLEKVLADYKALGEELAEDPNVKMARATLDILLALKAENCGPEQVQMLEKALKTAHELGQIRNSNVQRAENVLVFFYEKELGEAYSKRSLEALATALAAVDQSCLKDRVQGHFIFAKVMELKTHLKEMKQLTDKVGHLKSKDLKKLAGRSGREPHPHVQSVLMATFILLGERESDLWNWSVIQNLLERRSETGVARAMAELNVDDLMDKQVTLAEGHVRACQLDILKAEDPNSALFLQWVQGIVSEKRAREAVKQQYTLSKNSNN